MGGLWSKFEPIRPASRDCPESRPNSLKITKETTHFIMRGTRRASTTSRRRATAARRDTTAPRRYLVRNAFLNWDKDASGSLSYDEFRAETASSWPSHDGVGGFSRDFEPMRAASMASRHRAQATPCGS